MRAVGPESPGGVSLRNAIRAVYDPRLSPEGSSVIHVLARSARGSVVLAGALLLGSCGSGGGGSSGGTVAVQNEPTSTAGIVQLDFSFLIVSGLPDRVEVVSLAPGATASFVFSDA